MLLSLALAIPSCTVDAPVDDELLGETASELGIGPTVLTFYESSNFTGRSYQVSLSALDANERIRLISKPDIEAALLLSKVSSVRLKCGARDARVVLFTAHNASNTSFSAWSHTGGSGGSINCVSGQTVSVNLHTSKPELADRVGSAFLVTHASNAGNFNFTDYFGPAWEVALEDLPSAATPGRTDMWLESTTRFRIRQYLTIDHWACTARSAVFEYRVTMNSNRTFTATVTDSYVDSGFGDLWDCKNKMQATLDSSIAGATDDLEQGLADLVGLMAPGHDRYYFVPDVRLNIFDVFHGDSDDLVNKL